MGKKKAVPVVADDAPAAPVPEFRREARPTFVDPALLALEPGTIVRWHELAPHSTSVGQCTAKDLIAAIEDQIARQARGLFTIEEAASDMGQIHGWSRSDVESLRKQMMQAIRDKALKVRRNRIGPSYQPEVVREWFDFVTRDDVSAWLAKKEEPYRWPTYEDAAAEPRLIAGRRLWRLSEAVDYVSALAGFDVTRAALIKRASKAAAAGTLTVRDPEDGEPTRGDSTMPGYFTDWLYAEDFNSWLDSAGFREPYRLPEDARVADTPEPAALPVLASDDAPLPLITKDIAFCFAGLHSWDEAKWKRNLGNKPKWLQACIQIPGSRGSIETRWNPVCIGAAIVHQEHERPNRVRARFQREPMLKRWLDAWKAYEADNFDSP